MQKKLVILVLLILSGCESYSENKVEFLAEEESYKIVIPEKLKKIKVEKRYYLPQHKGILNFKQN